MAQTYRSSAARLPQWRIIDADSWTVRGPAGPELRRPPRRDRGIAAALSAAFRKFARFGRA